MSNSALAQAVVRTLASSASFSQGTLMLPNIRRVPQNVLRAAIPPPLQQWVLQSSDFDTVLIEQYRAIAAGQTKLLVCATGMGKTTRLPLMLISESLKVGIVLLPEQLLIPGIVKYVAGISRGFGGIDILVDVLRSEYVRNPPKKPAILYSTTADFLARFHDDPDMLSRLRVDFIYMDEYHIQSGANHFMRMLIGLGKFHTTKVFCGTATAKNTSMILVNKRGECNPVVIPPGQFKMHQPDALSSNNILHYSNVRDRTLVFLPTDDVVNTWFQYYDNHDVPVISFCTYDGSKVLLDVMAKLRNQAPLVLLCSGKLGTGHTLDIDTVVCTGYTQDIVVDADALYVEVMVRAVSESERKQRMGRVNRHLPGRAFYVDVPTTQDDAGLSDTDALYVYLWAREMIRRSANLLRAIQVESYFVGIDARARHSTISNVSFDMRAIKSYAYLAEYFLETARIEIGVELHRVSFSCFAVLNDDFVVLGTGWSFGTSVLMPYHVYEKSDVGDQTMLNYDVDKDFVVYTTVGITCSVFPHLRDPVEREEVILMGKDPNTEKVVKLGPFRVVLNGDVWCMNAVLTNGFSGFLLFSVIDTACIGMYLGYYATVGNDNYGHFVPSNDFATSIAKTFL